MSAGKLCWPCLMAFSIISALESTPNTTCSIHTYIYIHIYAYDDHDDGDDHDDDGSVQYVEVDNTTVDIYLSILDIYLY